MGWLRDDSHRGQGCQAWTVVGLPPWYPRKLASTGTVIDAGIYIHLFTRNNFQYPHDKAVDFVFWNTFLLNDKLNDITGLSDQSSNHVWLGSNITCDVKWLCIDIVPGLATTWPRRISSRLMPLSSAPTWSPASARSSVWWNISRPQQPHTDTQTSLTVLALTTVTELTRSKTI